MTNDPFDPSALPAQLLPQISQQMRAVMANMHMAFELLTSEDLGSLDAKVVQNLSILNQSYFRLLRLSKNLMYASLLSSEDPFATEPVELVAFVGALADPVEALAESKKIRFSFSADQPYLLTAIHTEYFQLLLYQLISNALKFTPAGGEVHLTLSGGRSGTDPVQLTVTDTGCGIAPEELDTVFDRYLHPDATPLPPHGLGLGLPLCRRIAQRHGGTLVIHSRKGEGTTVSVSLRRIKPQHASLSDILQHYEANPDLFFSADGYSTALTHLADALPFDAFHPKHTS